MCYCDRRARVCPFVSSTFYVPQLYVCVLGDLNLDGDNKLVLLVEWGGSTVLD